MSYKLHNIISHIAGVLLFMSLPVMFTVTELSGILPLLVSIPYLIFCSIFIGLFYVNGYFLIPRLYLKGKYLYYVFSLILLLGLVYASKPFDRVMNANDHFRPANPRRFDTPPDSAGPPPPFPGHRPSDNPSHIRKGNDRLDIVSIFLFILCVVMGMAVKITQQWRKTEQRAIQSEADRVKAELSFLKAQINPHFLFNTLNNIYTLALQKSEYTADSIMKLSHIMRYLTEDSAKNFVELAEEVNCISDYIDLQKLRLGQRSPVVFTVTGRLENKEIAPLLLMTFIENTFKYGLSKKELSPILIELKTMDNMIELICQNRMLDNHKEGHSSGIGIENTKQRLHYLYPEKHQLYIDTSNGLYRVKLILET